MGAAAAAIEGLLPSTTAHVFGRRRGRFWQCRGVVFEQLLRDSDAEHL